MVQSSGEIRGGRFVIVKPLGEGSQGLTFEGFDRRDNRAVAIKRFDVRGATSWKDVELAEREALVLRSLSHPRLPRYVDHFEQDGALYLVMEKIDGESLAAYRTRGASIGEADVWRLLRDASDVLGYLHSRAPPIIHRDLKPGNVIRRPDGSFAFVDFGAVRDKLRPKGGSTVVGTFGYMAPEQMQGRALPASDVYAMGATALALLTGREPEELPHRGLAIDVRASLRGRADGPVGAMLVAVLERMLEPDPDRRASSLAPLLSEAAARRGTGGAESRRAQREARGDRPSEADPAWEPWREQWREGRAGESRDDPWTERHPGRRSDRHARRAVRREERAARRAGRRVARRGFALPWPTRLVFALLLAVGMVVVSLAMRVIAPLILLVLSVLFAQRPLRNAAKAVKHAGDVAVDGLRRAGHWFRSDDGPSSEPAPWRVDTDVEPMSPRTRVARENGERGVGGDEHDADGSEDAAERRGRIQTQRTK